MIRIKPSFYDHFSCLASACRHSCCVGWEIDIDEWSIEKYAAIEGELGQELKHAIALEPEAHFILDAHERCPFLREDGLCRLYLALGESALCEICTLHPRFFNRFPGREEAGLGLCCEETVRLLLDTSEPFHMIEEDDGVQEETDPWIEGLASLRSELFAILLDTALSFRSRLNIALRRMDTARPAFRAEEWKRFFLSLERMDENWSNALGVLDSVREEELSSEMEDPRYAKILCYLLYRHFITADSEEEARRIFRFCVIATMLIAALGTAMPGETHEHLRAFSAEIEYSDENVEKICWEFP